MHPHAITAMNPLQDSISRRVRRWRVAVVVGWLALIALTWGWSTYEPRSGGDYPPARYWGFFNSPYLVVNGWGTTAQEPASFSREGLITHIFVTVACTAGAVTAWLRIGRSLPQPDIPVERFLRESKILTRASIALWLLALAVIWGSSSIAWAKGDIGRKWGLFYDVWGESYLTVYSPANAAVYGRFELSAYGLTLHAVISILVSLHLWYTCCLVLNHRRPSSLCRDCGYDLQGTPTGRPCPECGATHSRAA